MQNEPIKLIDREDEIVFTNWTGEDYEGRWNFSKNRKVYRLKAGKSYYLPFYLAEHFAKGLTDRELAKAELPTDHYSRQSFLDKCIQTQEPSPMEVERMQVKEVPLREVRLHTQERNAEYVDRGLIDSADLRQNGGGQVAVLPAETTARTEEAAAPDETAGFTE